MPEAQGTSWELLIGTGNTCECMCVPAGLQTYCALSLFPCSHSLACSTMSAFMSNLPDDHRDHREELGKGLAPGQKQRKPRRGPKSSPKCLIMTPTPTPGNIPVGGLQFSSGGNYKLCCLGLSPNSPQGTHSPVVYGAGALVLR